MPSSGSFTVIRCIHKPGAATIRVIILSYLEQILINSKPMDTETGSSNNLADVLKNGFSNGMKKAYYNTYYQHQHQKTGTAARMETTVFADIFNG